MRNLRVATYHFFSDSGNFGIFTEKLHKTDVHFVGPSFVQLPMLGLSLSRIINNLFDVYELADLSVKKNDFSFC